MPPTDRGFTMVELLMVLLITSILGGFGLSAYKGIEKIELATTASHIQSLIRTAQAEAHGEEDTHIVAFYSILGECNHIKNAKSINKIVLGERVNMNRTNFTNGKLYFRGKLSPSQGGTIVLNSKIYQVKITILPVTGRVKIYPITKKYGGWLCTS